MNATDPNTVETHPDQRILFCKSMVPPILSGRKTQTRRILNLSHAVGTPCAPLGHVLDLIYPGSVQHYGYVTPSVYPAVEIVAQRQRTWRVQRLCDEGCSHADDVGPYDGRHLRSWGPMRYSPGDRLWVSETWRTEERASDGVDGIRFAADDAFVRIENSEKGAERWVVAHNNGEYGTSWRPSIYMPRWASRITLVVTEVRIQRLQEISEGDARAEGCRGVSGAFGQMIPGPPLSARDEFARLWDSINGKRGKRVPWAANPWVEAFTFNKL